MAKCVPTTFRQLTKRNYLEFISELENMKTQDKVVVRARLEHGASIRLWRLTIRLILIRCEVWMIQKLTPRQAKILDVLSQTPVKCQDC